MKSALYAGARSMGQQSWTRMSTGVVVALALALLQSCTSRVAADPGVSCSDHSGGATAMSTGRRAGLSLGFYMSKCPRVEEIVRRTLRSAFRFDPSAPASLLRLAFHDCQVQACDASILLDSVPRRGMKGEREAAGNFGIRRLELIDRVKRALEHECPHTVSCADIVALAARDAVALTGGPVVAIQLGRRDSTSASASSAATYLPPASSSARHTLAVFSRYGMTVSETVAILGAHTLGVGHCVNVVDRLKYPGRDPSLSSTLYWQLRALCPSRHSPAVLPNDRTSIRFDSRYFKGVLSGSGLFAADAHLLTDARTKHFVTKFASDEPLFFRTFASAFSKMVGARVLTGNAGEVRTYCRRVN